MLRSMRHSLQFPASRFLFSVVLFISIIFIGNQKVFATHAAGSDIKYRALGGNQYEIEVTFYRDCGGVAEPANIVVNCKSVSGASNFNVTCTKVATGNGIEITVPCTTSNSTCNGGTTTGIKKWIYRGIATLPSQRADWVFSYSICCRNCSITTISNPCASNSVLYIEATLNNLLAQGNSSPSFSNIPIAFVCIGQPFNYNHGVIDINGDSLTYELITPKTTATNTVSFIAPASVNSPIASSTPFALNSVTGDFNFTPSQIQIGVMAIRVKEYRNGQLIGSVIRDMQIYTQICSNNLPTISGINGSTNYTANICPGQQYCFTINSADLDASQNVTLSTNNGIANATYTISGGNRPTLTFCWTPTLADISLNPNTFTVTVRDNACPTNGIQTYSYNLYVPGPHFTVAGTNVSCTGNSTGSATASPVYSGNYSYLWSTGATTASINNIVAGTYTVTATDNNNCSVSQSLSITEPSGMTLTSTEVNPSCANVNNGSIDLTVSGGIAPYSYMWNNGAATQDLSLLNSGTFTVTVTDGNACTRTLTKTLNNSYSFSVTPTSTDVSCFGLLNGAININITGGTTPFTYTWSNGSISQNQNGLAAGNYTVIASDVNGCTASTTSTILQPSATLSCTLSKTDVLCNTDETGSITSSVSGGTAPYTYLWNNGFTTADISGLTAGTYTLTVTDSHNCTKTTSITILQPLAALAIASTSTDVKCYGNNTGNITTTVTGGTTPYNYSWNNGGNTSSLSNVVAGEYSLTVTDANGCSALNTVTISAPLAALTTTPNSTNINCNGGQTGSAEITVSGGTSPYNYIWNTGAITSQITTIGNGNYTVTVTDQNGCQETNNFTITQPSAALSLSLTSTDVSCFNLSNASISSQVNGGTSPYNYNWSNGANSSDLTGISNGTYSLTVTDANGCSISGSKFITQPNAELSGTLTSTNVACINSNSGSISIHVSGGTTSYMYNWSNGNTTNENTSLVAGTYTVTVTDANGCNITESATLTEPSTALTISETHQNINCLGNGTGAITTVAAGGTTPYIYDWSNGSTNASNGYLSEGTYTITVTDQNGCTATTSATIIQPEGYLTSSGITTNINCHGGNNGAINITTTSGTPPYNFQWSTGETIEDLSTLSAGDYTITISDANGCLLVNQYHVVQPAATLGASIEPTAVSCFNELTGALNLTVTGGTSPFTYSWNNGATTENLSALATGTYTVNITDELGCTTSATANVEQPQLPLSMQAEAQNLGCVNDNSGAIAVAISGGTSPYNYQWDNGYTVPNLSGLPEGTYNLLVSDANGCELTQQFILTQPTATLAISPLTTSVDCNGNNTGSINLQPSGGTAPYNTTWTTGATGSTITTIPAGSYQYTIVDANQCTVTGSITINEPTAAIALTSSNTQVNCFGAGTGSIDINVSGGTAPYNYSWSNGSTTEDIANLTSGNYSVTITDANGCSSNTSILIQQPTAALSLQGNSTNAGCFAAANGTVTLTVTGGSSPYTFSWNNGNTTQNLQSLTAGNYTVLVADANGCTSTSAYIVTEPSQALIATITSTSVNCFASNSGSIIATATGGTSPYTYLWNNGTTASSLSNIVAGTYTVTITDVNGCSYTTNSTVQQPAATLSSTHLVQNVACFGGNTGIIQTTTSGGTAPYTYNWNTGASTSDINNVAAGTYSLTVTDANGCVYTQSLSVSQPASAVSSTLTNTSINCHGDLTASVDLTVTGGIGNYTYQWNNQQTTQDLTNVGAGTYSVVIIDQNGCTNNNTITITEPSISLTLGVTNTPAGCFGMQNGAITIQINGGTSPYSYLWNTGSTADNLINIGAGTYTVTVTDANGCSSTQTSTLSQPTSSISANATTTAANCATGEMGSITIDATGGTAPYTYLWNTGATTQNLTTIGAGTYTVTITDASGCQTTKSATITDNTSISIHTTGAPEICMGTMLTIYGDSIPGATYLWYYNGIALNGTNSFIFTTPVAGIYTMTATTSCGTYTSNPIEVIVRSLNNVTVNNDVIICGGESVQLHASGGMDYNWSPTTGLDHITIPDPIATPIQTTAYTVTVKDQYGCTATATVNVTVMCDSLDIPNGFSPNNDGTNDHFVIDGIDGFPGNVLFVYNRWGNLVYKQKDYDNNWDGRSNVNGVMYGQEMPNGTYYFILNLNNDEKPVNGFVVIRR